MCGLVLAVHKDHRPVDKNLLACMCSTIQHRGPDATGYCISADQQVGLAHTRLSIIDQVSGNQPIFNEDGSIAVILNGEIYDHLNWHRSLKNSGHKFYTQSDTEVIVHLYEEFGLGCIEKLNGEFAFILHDRKKNKLLLARDRIGVKPLYYYHDHHRFLACSEVKGLMAVSTVPRRMSNRYFMGPIFGAYDGRTTPFADIYSLKPGHLMEIDLSKEIRPIERPYWQAQFKTDESMTLTEASEGVSFHLEEAVKRRLVSDVPVHCYLSGGIDSTLVTGLARKYGPKTLRAYTLSFSGTNYDEASQAKQIANHYGVDLQLVDCTMDMMADRFLDTIYHIEMPMVNPHAIGKMMLSEHIRSKGLKVCLTGEGSDELFAGYPYFKLQSMWEMALNKENPKELKRLWKYFRKVESRSEGVAWNRGEYWKDTLNQHGFLSFQFSRACQYGRMIPKLYNWEALGTTENLTPDKIMQEVYNFDELKNLHHINIARLFALNQLNGHVIPVLGDRVEMANSLECRTPFLDPNLIDWAHRIPAKHLVNLPQLREKFVLHKAFENFLPKIVKSEHKHPFLAPNWSCFSKTKRGKSIFNDLLSKQALDRAGIYSHRMISKLKLLWRIFPQNSSLKRRLDTLMGCVLSTQALHQRFIMDKIQVAPLLSMDCMGQPVTLGPISNSRPPSEINLAKE